MSSRLILRACEAACIAIAAVPAFAAEAPALVKVQLKTGRTVVGELEEQSAKQVKLRDLKNGTEATYAADDVSKVQHNLADNGVIAYAGLPGFVAWKLSRNQASATGKVADVKPTAIYVTVGTKSGIRKGHKLFVYRDEGEIKDPDTGEVLERERAKIAELEVTDAREKFSKAKLLGDLEVQIRVGDQVETDRAGKIIAVLPPIDETKHGRVAGERLAEELATALVARGMRVVERTLLGQVIDELDLQGLFEDATLTRKVGKQLGANAIMTARLVQSGRILNVHVRLINVETGEVLLAASQKTTGDAGDVLIEEHVSRRGNNAPAGDDAEGRAGDGGSAEPRTQATRARWFNESYNTTVRYMKGKTWQHVDNKTGRVLWVGKETARTTDYIEILSEHDHVRLRAQRMDFHKDGKWGWVANGHWEAATNDAS